jgi:hypothetical protein
MRLVVDRTRPQGSLQCDLQSDRRLVVSSIIQDAKLNQESVRLLLRTDVNSQPADIPVQIQSATADTTSVVGTVTLPDCRSFELLLLASDMAGNRLSHSERYYHPLLADENDALLPAWDDLHANEAGASSAPNNTADLRPTVVELQAPQAAVKTHLVSATGNQSIVRKREVLSNQPLELVPPQRATAALPQPVETQPAAATAGSADVISKSRKFMINYQLSEAVPAQQLQVELWVTKDGGQSWEYWGVDRDRVSPAFVEVEDAGEYGFCVVCLENANDARFRPKPGDLPDLTVKVEETPTVRRLQPVAR